jgi:hypothetical protein
LFGHQACSAPNGAPLGRASKRAWNAPVGADTVVIVELAFIFRIAPGRLGADRIGRRVLKLALIDFDDVAAEVVVVSQQRLGQRG